MVYGRGLGPPHDIKAAILGGPGLDCVVSRADYRLTQPKACNQ